MAAIPPLLDVAGEHHGEDADGEEKDDGPIRHFVDPLTGTSSLVPLAPYESGGVHRNLRQVIVHG
jgi:hypothetical protein